METFHFKSSFPAKSHLVHLTTSRACDSGFHANYVRVISSSFYLRTTAAPRPALYAHYGSRFGFSARYVAAQTQALSIVSSTKRYSFTALQRCADVTYHAIVPWVQTLRTIAREGGVGGGRNVACDGQ